MPDITKINEYIQNTLIKYNLVEVTAIRAAVWIDDAGLLNDDKQRPGRNLRQLCRENKIKNAVQRDGRYWFILRND